MLFKIFKMAVGGTTTMTLFSYLFSVKKNEKFLEPLILNQLVYPRSKKDNAHHLAGYIIHYFVGLLFSPVYYLLFNNSRKSSNLVYIVLAGLCNGLIGVAGWHVSIHWHKKPPKIKLKPYYAQLVLAHIIFALANVFILKRKQIIKK